MNNRHIVQGKRLSRREFLQAQLTLTAGGVALAGGLVTAGAANTGGWQVGCYTRPWDKFEWPVAFDAIAEAGYKYIGLMTSKGKEWVMVRENTALDEAHRFAEEAKQRGLKVISAYGTFPMTESVGAGVENLKLLIDRCAAAGSPNLLLGGTSDEKLYAPYYQTIAECAGYAAEKRVGLSIKPHGGLNATGKQCREAIRRVNHKNFGLWYDPGNIFYYSDGKLNPVDDAATVDGLVVGMSVKDFLPPKDVMVTPGTGRVDFRKVMARLRQGGFNGGPLVVECVKLGELAQITAEAKRARVFLEELLAQ